MLLVQAAVVPKALYASTFNGIAQALLAKLESSILRALWGPGRGLRCKEIILTLFVPGHWTAPQQYVDFTSLVALHRLVTKHRPLQEIFRQVWHLRSSSGRAFHGVVKNLRASVRRLEWTWVEPFTVITAAGNVWICLRRRLRLYNMLSATHSGPCFGDVQLAVVRTCRELKKASTGCPL